jgi:hypothetical protein
LYGGLCELLGLYGRLRTTSPPPGFDPQTVQPLSSLYNDCVISAH